jgi:hypothetical protein
LLGGVWYYHAPDELRARLYALAGQNAGEKLLELC